MQHKTRKSAAQRRPVRRPNFKPLWSKDEALAAANDALRLNHPTAVGERLAAVLLSGSPDTMCEKHLDEKLLMEMSDLLSNARNQLELRMQLCREAERRLLVSAKYALGREAAKAVAD